MTRNLHMRLPLIGFSVFAGLSSCRGGTIRRQDNPDAPVGQTDAPNPDMAVKTTDDAVVIHLPDTQIPESLPSFGCSRDLHGIVDQTGKLVETCRPEQGCQEGVCVPACHAVPATHGNVGCDFLIARPPLAAYPTSCFAIFVANNWDQAVTIRVSRGGASYDVGKFARVSATGTPETAWSAIPSSGLPKGQVAVLFLEGGPKQVRGCPIDAAVDTYTTIEKTGRGQAWHVVTDIPVSVYDIVPYGGADSLLPSAELVLPTTTFSDNYVAVVPMFRISTRRISFPASQWAQIIAAEDGTEVQIVPRTALPSGDGIVAAPEKLVTAFSLSAGEVLQWKGDGGKEMEMSGSIISSSRPIGFVGGNDYLCIDSSTSTIGGCDSAHQQIPPVNALGSRYVVAPHPNRRSDGQQESAWYRFVGAVDGTTLAYDPPMPGAPTALAQGQWVNFEAVGAFEVSSQDGEHPFYVAQTMSGAGVTAVKPGTPGDEEFVNVVPPAQFFPSYVFYTDPTYTTTALVLTQCDEGRGFEDVEVECMGPVGGWAPVGTGGKCRWASVNLVDNGKGVGACQNGPQLASSSEPFGLTVWGLSSYASYAYPAGAGVTPINQVVIPPYPIP
jgi:hypothetical protein